MKVYVPIPELSEDGWIELDPDYRKEDPEEPHCCRCMKRFKEGGSFMMVDIKYEGACAFVRKNPLGKHLLGEDCWKKIKNR